MSKENALSFLQKAAADPALKEQIQDADAQTDLVELGAAHGYSFSAENIRDALPTIKEQKGFFGDLIDAILELFGPTHDDYPATGVQPYSGEPGSDH